MGTPLIIAFGVALLAVGWALWRVADTIDLRMLAVANSATAAAAVIWRIAASGFSSSRSALVVLTAAALALLASAQFAAGRLRPSPSG